MILPVRFVRNQRIELLLVLLVAYFDLQQFGMSVNALRPRGAMARNFYEKIFRDRQLREMDKTKWYKIKEDDMKNRSTGTWSKFEEMSLDAETQDFLDNCFETSDSVCYQMWLTFANSILSWFLTPTSVNGLLGRGSMFVFSSVQFEKLIGWTHESGIVFDSLLDIGAGDGSTTDRIKRYFNKVYVTEMSTPMKWMLTNKGYTVLEQDWTERSNKFSFITCLNVLDRCLEPISLLGEIKKALAPGGTAVVSFVIPFAPYVEFGSEGDHKPKELMPIRGSSFNEEVQNFISNVLEPNGWSVIKWSKLPYLCEGNVQQAFYSLTDAIFVIQPNDTL